MRRHFQRADLQTTLTTLVIASVLGAALLAARIIFTGQFRQLYLIWNLVLAWVPLFLALRVEELEQDSGTGRAKFWAISGLWLLFFPNAPYIFTDLIHINRTPHPRIWTDMLIVLVFALTGLVLGFLSLQRMHRLVVGRRGRVIGWIFVGWAALASGFGVYLGRFERWNSWDLFLNPYRLLVETMSALSPYAVVFSILFGVFVLTAYAILYSLMLQGALLHAPVRIATPLSK